MQQELTSVSVGPSTPEEMALKNEIAAFIIAHDMSARTTEFDAWAASKGYYDIKDADGGVDLKCPSGDRVIQASVRF